MTLFLVLSMAVSCGRKEDDGDNFSCPSISDNATFTSYGPFRVHNSGRDSTARKIISECGWHVYKGHNGGYGDTLEVASPGEEVVLRWAWNAFNWMYLFEGWQGKTAEGIGMGATLSAVQTAYPDLTYYSNDLYKLKSIGGDPASSADFYFENSLLVRINIW